MSANRKLPWCLATAVVTGLATVVPASPPSGKTPPGQPAAPTPPRRPTSAPAEVELLVKKLHHRDESVRRLSAVELGKLGARHAEVTVAPLTEVFLRDESFDVRRDALIALGKIGPAAGRETMDLFLQAIRERDIFLHAALCEALPAWGEDARGVMPTLLKFRLDPNKKVREPAEAALQKIFERPALRGSCAAAASDDPDPEIRIAACRTIAELGRDGLPYIWALCERATLDGDPDVQIAAIRALGELGPVAAYRSVPALRPLTDSMTAGVKSAANAALAKIDPPKPVEKTIAKPAEKTAGK